MTPTDSGRCLREERRGEERRELRVREISTFSGGRARKSPAPVADDRFWSKVDAAGDCWLWAGAMFRNGYGLASWGDRQLLAHRVAYAFGHGPVPDGLEVDHLCRNRRCVNPDHLQAVSHRENVLRGAGFSARHARQRECRNGHQFDRDNTRILIERGRSHPRRQCRACDRLRHQARRAA